jgi:pyridoxal phosphate enzyme (YggS family)
MDDSKMGLIAARLQAVQDRIARACQAAGRDPGEVRLLPVSKTRPLSDVVDFWRVSGIGIFGENHAQELTAKAEELSSMGPELANIRFAMIGPLQANKTKLVAARAAEFHALDSLKTAKRLDSQLTDRDRTLDVFIEVNSSGEPQKSGLDPDAVQGFAEQLAQYPRLHVRGLMTVALNSPDQALVRACFERMTTLRAQLRDAGTLGIGWDELSMGMSSDLEPAIEYGATTVRIGTALFGPRAARVPVD